MKNAPCPCGSGKKYKRCCLGKADNAFPGNPTQSIMMEVQDAIDGHDFTSIEELNKLTSQIANRQNQTTKKDFCGLSAEQMHCFLYSPFDSPDLITFSTQSSAQPQSRIMTLFLALVNALGDTGIKATAKGNLPLSLCKEMAQRFMEKKGYPLDLRYRSIRTELDFEELHCTRLVAVMAGLIRKYRGKFLLTKKCQQMLAAQDEGKIYFELFKTYVMQFNWGYRDGYPDIELIQMAFLFTLFLLHKYGGVAQTQSYYGDKFITAFPMVCQMMPESNYSTPEEDVRRCYSLRALERFAGLFGLIEFEGISDNILDRNHKIVKSQNLDKFVVFKADQSRINLH